MFDLIVFNYIFIKINPFLEIFCIYNNLLDKDLKIFLIINPICV